MFKCLSDQIRKIAKSIIVQSEGSPYNNMPFYQTLLDPSDTKQELMSGPPSLYNDIDRSDRIKNEEDMRRQGPRPTPTDYLTTFALPVTVTNIGNPKEDEQGEVSDTTTPEGRNEDRETINFDPGELNVNPFRN